MIIKQYSELNHQEINDLILSINTLKSLGEYKNKIPFNIPTGDIFSIDAIQTNSTSINDNEYVKIVIYDDADLVGALSYKDVIDENDSTVNYISNVRLAKFREFNLNILSGYFNSIIDKYDYIELSEELLDLIDGDVTYECEVEYTNLNNEKAREYRVHKRGKRPDYNSFMFEDTFEEE